MVEGKEMKIEYLKEKEIRKQIKKCEGKHIQQVVFSTYHNAFTQICFSCNKVRTSLRKEEKK